MDGIKDPSRDPLVIAAIDQPGGLPTAIGLDFAGKAESIGPDDSNHQKLVSWLKHADIRKDRDIIVYCHNKNCWLSYNAALRLIGLGYKHVFWMRDGIDGWTRREMPIAYVKLNP